MKPTNYRTLSAGSSNEDLSLKITGTDRLSELLEKAERHIIKLAMKKCKGNQSTAALALGMSRGNLRTKLKKYFGDSYFMRIIG